MAPPTLTGRTTNKSIYDPSRASERTTAARRAFEQARVSLAAGDATGSERWLDRARRLGLRGPILAVLSSMIANLRNDPMAVDQLETLARDNDSIELWLAAISASCRRAALAGQNPDSTIFQPMLARTQELLGHCLSLYRITDGLASLADQVVALSPTRGWCGLDGEGRLRAGPAGPCEVWLDGARIDLVPGEPVHALSGGNKTTELRVYHQGKELLGSPIQPKQMRRVRGSVHAEADCVSGWAWTPGNPDTVPTLIAIGASGQRVRIRPRREPVLPPGSVMRARGFRITRKTADRLGWPLRIVSDDANDIDGSPLACPDAIPRRRKSAVPDNAPNADCAASTAALRRWVASLPSRTILVISHNRGGGVSRAVRARLSQLGADQAGLELVPRERGCILRTTQGAGETSGRTRPDLIFQLPAQFDLLVSALKAAKPERVELHHLLGHAPAIADLPARLGIRPDIHLHDYASVCPQITFVDHQHRYCGEPPVEVCETCAASGNALGTRSVAKLLMASAKRLEQAARVVVPTTDMATRLLRHLPRIAPEIEPLEQSVIPAAPRAKRPDTGPLHVIVCGALNIDKGFDVVLACARDAQARRLDLRFTVVGYTVDDEALLETGHAFVTGEYAEEEAVPLLRAQAGDIGFLPSICPETWSFSLSELWRAGLNVAAFDLGAQAVRIRSRMGGLILPLGLHATRINDVLLAWRGTSEPGAGNAASHL